MLIENAFEVAAPADPLWTHLLEVERIVPCLPGAELTETVDDHTWKGRFHVRFGPVAMAFAGTVTMESRDDEARRVVLRAQGMEERGKGAAQARVTAWLEPATESGTAVRVESDIVLSGAAAQLSRGLLPEIARRLTQEFADRLEASMRGAEISATREAAVASPEPPAPGGGGAPVMTPSGVRPVGGIRLALSAAWAAVGRFVRRVLRRGDEGE